MIVILKSNTARSIGWLLFNVLQVVVHQKVSPKTFRLNIIAFVVAYLGSQVDAHVFRQTV